MSRPVVMTVVRPWSRAPRGARAFTLIELLTVIAIVAILAGILFAVLGKARESARATEDAGRLRACHQALSLFAAENRGRMKGASQWVNGAGAWQADNTGGGAIFMTWSNWLIGLTPSPTGPQLSGLTRYITDPKVFLSPSVSPDTYVIGASPSPIYRTFGMYNGGGPVAGYSPADWIQRGEHTLSLVPVPGRIPLLADTATNSQGGTVAGWGFYYFRSGGLSENAGIHLRYSDKANVVFYDGHLARLGRQELAALGFTQAVSKDFQTINLP